jgi:hypothetical protein
LTPPGFSQFAIRPLPFPSRGRVIEAGKAISEWSHTRIDDLVIEAGVPGIPTEREVGSRRDRSNTLVRFALDNPSSLTAENSLFTAYLVKRASLPDDEDDLKESTFTFHILPSLPSWIRSGSGERNQGLRRVQFSVIPAAFFSGFTRGFTSPTLVF